MRQAGWKTKDKLFLLLAAFVVQGQSQASIPWEQEIASEWERSRLHRWLRVELERVLCLLT